MKKIFYEIPEGFKIGASSSAWQSEGWKGKKENQVSWADAFYKSAPSNGTKVMDQPLLQISIAGIKRTLN